jgi:hypothetical protein
MFPKDRKENDLEAIIDRLDKSGSPEPVIMNQPQQQSINPQFTLPPHHRIWQNGIDAFTYIAFLIIALTAAMYHVEATAFWASYTGITIGVLIRSRGGKIDADTVLKLTQSMR